MSKPILCLDFDGVLHSYTSAWERSDRIPDPPVFGAMVFLEQAVEHFDVQILSSRSREMSGIDAMCRWLETYLREHYDGDDVSAGKVISRIKFPIMKPAAFLTIDDRALCFDGNWPALKPEELLKFKPWNKR